MGLFDFVIGKKEDGVEHREKERSVQATFKQDSDDVSLLNQVAGMKEQLVQVEKKVLSDGSTYTGGAILLGNGTCIPHGYGKKLLKDLELYGFYDKGKINGVCYVNMHFAMVLGHFKDNRPKGWCMSIENGYQFGVMEYDDFTNCISNHMTWIAEMIKGISGSPIHIYSKKGQILYGLNMGQIKKGLYFYNGPTGMFFMNNGDVFFGTDDQEMTKTGVFVKYGNDGLISMGKFENAKLIEAMSTQEVLDFYLGSSEETIGILGMPKKPKAIRIQLANFDIDTSKNYF